MMRRQSHGSAPLGTLSGQGDLSVASIPDQSSQVAGVAQSSGNGSYYITVSQLSHVYETKRGGRVEALRDVTFEVARDEFVTIVGASGCGKSTLLRLVGGLAQSTAGTIQIDGSPVRGPRDDVGHVFQSPALLEWRNTLKNVLLPVECRRGRVDAQAIGRARELLRLAGLEEEFEDRYPAELSGGMQQRVGICRALINDPLVLLMDEPLGSLDALTREELALELLRIWTERKKTVLFVTHSIPEAVLLADRVIVMTPRPGRVQAVIPVDLPRPRTFEMESSPKFAEIAGQVRELIFSNKGSR